MRTTRRRRHRTRSWWWTLPVEGRKAINLGPLATRARARMHVEPPRGSRTHRARRLPSSWALLRPRPDDDDSRVHHKGTSDIHWHHGCTGQRALQQRPLRPGNAFWHELCRACAGVPNHEPISTRQYTSLRLMGGGVRSRLGSHLTAWRSRSSASHFTIRGPSCRGCYRRAASLDWAGKSSVHISGSSRTARTSPRVTASNRVRRTRRLRRLSDRSFGRQY